MPNPRVLIIDDEPSVHDSLRRVVAKQKFDVITAGSVAEGLAAFDAFRPEVVVLDLNLPDGAGLTAFRRIHELEPRCPVIFITADGTTETALAAMKEGAFETLVKPVDLDRLTPLLEQATEAARLLRAPSLVPTPDADGPNLRQLVAALQPASHGNLYARVIQAVDRVVLAAVMEQTHGNQLRASEILGIDRKTLRHKLRSLGLAADKTNGLAPHDPLSTPS